MSKFLFVTFISLWSVCSFAQGYELQSAKKNSQIDIFMFSEMMVESNFFPIDNSHLGSVYKNDMDQIFLERSRTDHFAVLKFDLKYLGASGLYKISETEYICHGSFDSFTGPRSFALFTSGIDKSVIEKSCASLGAAQTSAFKKYYLPAHLAQAVLMNCVLASTGSQLSSCSRQDNFKSLNSIKNVSSYISSEEFMQKMGTCAIDALRGAGGVFTGTIDSVKSLLTTSPKELWTGLKNNAQEIIRFVTHLKEEMFKLKNAFNQLDDDLILAIGCPLAGEILTGAGISALTGAGAAMLTTRVLQIMSKMSKLNHLFVKLNKISRVGNKTFAGKVLRCGVK